MKTEEQTKLFKEFIQKQEDILLKKRNDYANNDVMSNFKQVSNITGMTPEQSILVLIATKVARLGNLFQGKKPNNESIDDSIIDMANYCFLLYCIREEQKSNSTTPPFNSTATSLLNFNESIYKKRRKDL